MSVRFKNFIICAIFLMSALGSQAGEKLAFTIGFHQKSSTVSSFSNPDSFKNLVTDDCVDYIKQTNSGVKTISVKDNLLLLENSGSNRFVITLSSKFSGVCSRIVVYAQGRQDGNALNVNSLGEQDVAQGSGDNFGEYSYEAADGAPAISDGKITLVAKGVMAISRIEVYEAIEDEQEPEVTLSHSVRNGEKGVACNVLRYQVRNLPEDSEIKLNIGDVAIDLKGENGEILLFPSEEITEGSLLKDFGLEYGKGYEAEIVVTSGTQFLRSGTYNFLVQPMLSEKVSDEAIPSFELTGADGDVKYYYTLTSGNGTVQNDLEYNGAIPADRFSRISYYAVKEDLKSPVVDWTNTWQGVPDDPKEPLETPIVTIEQTSGVYEDGSTIKTAGTIVKILNYNSDTRYSLNIIGDTEQMTVMNGSECFLRPGNIGDLKIEPGQLYTLSIVASRTVDGTSEEKESNPAKFITQPEATYNFTDTGDMTLSLAVATGASRIYYTIDDNRAIEYSEPIIVSRGKTVKYWCVVTEDTDYTSPQVFITNNTSLGMTEVMTGETGSRYFTLQGIELPEAPERGLYIEISGEKREVRKLIKAD